MEVYKRCTLILNKVHCTWKLYCNDPSWEWRLCTFNFFHIVIIICWWQDSLDQCLMWAMSIKIMSLIRNASQCRSLPIDSSQFRSMSDQGINITLVRIQDFWEWTTPARLLPLIGIKRNWSALIGIDWHWDQCQNFDGHWALIQGVLWWSVAMGFYRRLLCKGSKTTFHHAVNMPLYVGEQAYSLPTRQLTDHWQPTMLKFHKESDFHHSPTIVYWVGTLLVA